MSKKLEYKIRKLVGQAISDFKMIKPHDRLLVAISGGKDSWALLHILNQLKQRAPIPFTLVAVNIDQGFSGFRQDQIENHVKRHQFEYHMEEMPIAEIIEQKSPNKIPCALCSRLRRGRLYGLAIKYNCNKIALGHHLDDFIETLLLNAFFVGRLASMAPKLKSKKESVVVIRPLVYVKENDIIKYSESADFPIVCCACPLMCGQARHMDQNRRFIKNLIGQLEERIPNIRQSLLTSLGNLQPSHLLDLQKWDF